MSRMVDISEEPVGETYRALIDGVAATAASFALVWRDQLTFDARADSLRVALAPFLLSEDHTTEWPGTKLLEHKAWVRRYRTASASVRILKEAPSLYSWISPSRPEDLSVLLPSGECILGSIAHERDAWLALGDSAVHELAGRLPGLKLTR